MSLVSVAAVSPWLAWVDGVAPNVEYVEPTVGVAAPCWLEGEEVETAEPADPDSTATTGADDPCVAVCDVGLGWTVCAVRAEALGGGVDEARPRDGGRPVLAPLDAGEGLVARAGDSGAALDEGDEGDEVTEDKEAVGEAVGDATSP